MTWDKPRILRELRKLHRAGRSLAYCHLGKHRQSLLSAAAYHFGSYRKAIGKAGIDYSHVSLRPKWTKQRIIALIKQTKRAGQNLHWGAVSRRRDQLGRAAHAALQRRLFGSWVRALHAAGLDADDVCCYRSWDRNCIAFEFRLLLQNGEAVNSGAIQKDDPGLHSAAIRHFGSFDAALRAARIDPRRVRLKRRR